jgi:uncharacterized membrane protein
MNETKKLTLTGLMTAAVTVATIAIIIPVPYTGGYIHAGDSMIFLSVLLLGWKRGAFAAGVGSAMADILSGYTQWAPATLVIKTLMAVLMGLVIQQAAKNGKVRALIAALLAIGWLAFHFIVMMIVGNPPANDAGGIPAGDFPGLIDVLQTQMMVAALAIPVLLALAGLIGRKSKKLSLSGEWVLGGTAAGFLMVFGYFIAGGLMYGNYVVAALSIPMNLIQFVVGFLIAAAIWPGVKRLRLE